MSYLMDLFVREVGMDLADLRRVITTAPVRYKVYEIPKRNGEMREIAQPAREVKALQYVLIRSILEKCPVHNTATAYRAGKSVLDNAAPHGGSGPILKMDFQDFFPSIRASDWDAYCQANRLLDEEDRRISSLVLFRRAKGEQLLKLSVGAPSSPMLSNILMFRFDEIISHEALRRGITYTRYADDLTFSGQRIGMLKDMLREVARATRQNKSPSLTINQQKTTFVTAAVKRVVTGVVLANDSSTGLGHKRRREISSGVHRASLGRLTDEELRALAGQLAFANVVDRNFLDWLRKKYGSEIVSQIKSLKSATISTS